MYWFEFWRGGCFFFVFFLRCGEILILMFVGWWACCCVCSRACQILRWTQRVFCKWMIRSLPRVVPACGRYVRVWIVEIFFFGSFFFFFVFVFFFFFYVCMHWVMFVATVDQQWRAYARKQQHSPRELCGSLRFGGDRAYGEFVSVVSHFRGEKQSNFGTRLLLKRARPFLAMDKQRYVLRTTFETTDAGMLVTRFFFFLLTFCSFLRPSYYLFQVVSLDWYSHTKDQTTIFVSLCVLVTTASTFKNVKM